jgi:hypothetical protein
MNEFVDDEPKIDINKMFEIHYTLSELFENILINTINIHLPEENDYGFIEYKRNLASYKNKLYKLKTQIYWRLSEGITYNSQNTCYYILGIEDNGLITNPITQDEITNSLNIINKSTENSDIKYIHRQIIYQNYPLLIIKFWKEDILSNTDIRIILLGASESGKTKFFVGLHNCKFNIFEPYSEIKPELCQRMYPTKQSNTEIQQIENNMFNSKIFDIHTDENKLNKTLILHHQYFNVNYNKKINLIDVNNLSDIQDNLNITEDYGLNIHIIDTPGNSIISNIKYLIGYNADIIIYFNHTNNLYERVLEQINNKYNNVIKITDTSYLSDFNTKKLLHQALLKYQSINKILNGVEDILLINENRLIQCHQQTKFNKYIFYCYNLMNLNIFDKISDITIRNIQCKYNYKSSIHSNNSISIETNKQIHRCILGKTSHLEILELGNLEVEDNDILLTYYIIILNQIYIINAKNIPCKIIFDKIILIPEKYINIPIFIIWCKNNEFFMKIVDI